MACSLLTFGEHVSSRVNLFSISLNDLDDGMECVLVKSASISGWTVSRSRIQSHLKLEKQTQKIGLCSVWMGDVLWVVNSRNHPPKQQVGRDLGIMADHKLMRGVSEILLLGKHTWFECRSGVMACQRYQVVLTKSQLGMLCQFGKRITVWRKSEGDWRSGKLR